MFGWLFPKCPVTLRDKVWVEERMRWLIREFGSRTLIESNTILPTPEFFPDTYRGIEDDVPQMLRRVCDYMQCDASRFRLTFFDGNSPSRDEDGNLLSGAAGYYVASGENGPPMIRISTTNLQDPLALVATLAHEVAHDRLLGEQRLTVNVPDHEPLTDLTTVFFGLGVFPANTAFRSASWKDGMMQVSVWSTQGYLKDNVFGYALALRSWLRDEPRMRWASYLTTNARHAYQAGLRYLQRTSDCLATRGEMLNGALPQDVTVDELESGSDGLRLSAIQRMWDRQSPTAQHVAAIVNCLRSSHSAIQAEAINWLHTQEPLPTDAVDLLLDLLRVGRDDVPLLAATLLSDKLRDSDDSSSKNRLLQELIGLSSEVNRKQLVNLVEPLSRFGPCAEPALRPLLSELRRWLIERGPQSASFLVNQLLLIDPNLDSRVSRQWPETIVNLYEVAAKHARKSRNHKTKSKSRSFT